MRVHHLLNIIWLFYSGSSPADIAVDWDAKNYGIIFESAKGVHLGLCPGELPVNESLVSRNCAGRRDLDSRISSSYFRNLRVLKKVPQSYAGDDGVVKVSTRLEVQRRALTELSPGRPRQKQSLEDEILSLEGIQDTLIINVQHHIIQALQPDRNLIFQRGNGEDRQWLEVISSFAQIFYTGNRWLRFVSGSWNDQFRQCFAPWKPWSGNLDVVAEALRMGLGKTMVWTTSEHFMIRNGPWPYGDHSNIPMQGMAKDMSKFRLDESGQAVPATTANRMEFVGMAVVKGGFAPSKSPYDFEVFPKESRYEVLCLLGERE